MSVELNLTAWKNTCGYNIESAEATSRAYVEKQKQMQTLLDEIDQRIKKLAELYEKADGDRREQITQAHNFAKSYQRPPVLESVLECQRLAQLWQRRADELKSRKGKVNQK